MKHLLSFIILLSTSSLWSRSNQLCEALRGTQQVYGKVVKVSDGDTFTVAIKVAGRYQNNSVRLLGIDTPESHYQSRSQGHWADQATASLNSMLKYNQDVLLEFENEPCDSYGRFIAKVKTKYLDVNKEQVRRGMAATYCYATVTSTCREYSAVMREAMVQRKGMYQDANLVMPYIFRYMVNEKARSAYIMNMDTQEVVDFEEIHSVPPHLRVFIPGSR